MKFVLNGCDISFVAEAPEDITLKQLLKQCDRIVPNWCSCGICTLETAELSINTKTEIVFDYDDVRKTDDEVNCEIKE